MAHRLFLQISTCAALLCATPNSEDFWPCEISGYDIGWKNSAVISYQENGEN